MDRRDAEIRRWLDTPYPEPPKPLPPCGTCKHFTPDKIGNGSGLGWCRLKKDNFYPGVRTCRDHA